ncbi:MAG: hypothetical protein A2W77_09335 [Nitrospinae bacterium RIFCSPLOWO2_12_39_16]|nr:MAG: hypothetical protein A2W77_09335 [Nitrospinae bacterium RIFCSPLOWO2_12_39_16]
MTQIRDPLLQPGEIGEYYQIWRKSLMAPLQRVQSEVRGLLEARFSSAHEFANAIEPKLQIACQDSDEGFGSSTDSEQYLLQFLRRGIPSIEAPTPRLIRECEKLRGTYVTQKMNFFKHRLFNTQDIDALIRGTEELKQNLLRFKNAREIGYILHLHSTREFCRCCAISLSQDLMRGALIEGVMNIVRARNGGGGIEPFFLVLGSCSSLMFNPTSEKEIYARQGIGKENTLPPTSYYSSTVLIEDVLKRRLFLQKLFSEHKDS